MTCGSAVVNGVPVAEGAIVGGSGAEYATLADWQAGEFGQEAADVTAAGTVAGTVVGTVLPPWLAPGNLIVLTDATPGNSLACVYGLIVSIAGATITIDKPWNFGVGETITYVQVITGTVKGPLAPFGLFAATKSMVLSLAGHIVPGGIDFAGGAYHEIAGGSGFVIAGITTTNLSVTVLSDIALVGRRLGTIYAYIMTSGSNIGATECYNCGFGGVVSGRRGIGRWIIDDCENDGVAETDQNLAWRLNEAPVGGVLVITNVNMQVAGKFGGGSLFYSEGTGSLTGPAAFIAASLFISLQAPTAGNVDIVKQPVNYFTYVVNGAATLTLTAAVGSYVEVNVAPQPLTFTAAEVSTTCAGVVCCVNFTGTYSVNVTHTLTAAGGSGTASPANLANIFTQGAATTTGSITAASTVTFTAPACNVNNVLLNAPFSGSITESGAFIVLLSNLVRVLTGSSALATITAGAPTMTFSGNSQVTYCNQFQLTSMSGVVSLGTFVFSGTYLMNVAQPTAGLFVLAVAVSGGAWSITNTITVGCFGRSATGGMTLFSSAATGGALTVSSVLIRVVEMHAGAFTLIESTGAGGSLTLTSAADVVIRGCKFYSASTIVTATTATSTARMQGTLQFEECEFAAAVTVINSTLAGGVAEMRDLTFNNCVFESTLTDRSGAGTITWTTRTWNMRDCFLYDLWTFTATSFTTVECWNCTFNGAAANKSITATGTRPTTYRIWYSSFKARYDDKLPEVIRAAATRSNNAALAKGQPTTINATPLAVACAAGSVVEGLLLIATTGAAGEAAVLVTDGDIFVKVDATVLAGDNLTLDLATPTQCILGAFTPGQNAGRALEAAAATLAGLAYSQVSVK